MFLKRLFFSFLFLSTCALTAKQDFSRELELLGMVEKEPACVRACQLVRSAISAANKGWSRGLEQKYWEKAVSAFGEKSRLAPHGRELYELCVMHGKRLLAAKMRRAGFYVALGVATVALVVVLAAHRAKERATNVRTGLPLAVYSTPLLQPCPRVDDADPAQVESYAHWQRSFEEWQEEVRGRVGDQSLTPQEIVNVALLGRRNLEGLTAEDSPGIWRHYGRILKGGKLSDRQAEQAIFNFFAHAFARHEEMPVFIDLAAPSLPLWQVRRITFGRVGIDHDRRAVTFLEPPLLDLSYPYTGVPVTGRYAVFPAFDCLSAHPLTIQDNLGLLLAYIRQQEPDTVQLTDQEALARAAEMLLRNGVNEEWGRYEISLRGDKGFPRLFSIQVRIEDGRISFNSPPRRGDVEYLQDAQKMEQMISKAFNAGTCCVCLAEFEPGESVACWDCTCSVPIHLEEALRMPADKGCPLCRTGASRNRFYTRLPERR